MRIMHERINNACMVKRKLRVKPVNQRSVKLLNVYILCEEKPEPMSLRKERRRKQGEEESLTISWARQISV